MNIAIIGAGPAGIYTSLLLKNFPGEVVLFEQNAKIGEKLRLTGGGRMNVTNKCFSSEEFTSSSPQLLKNLFKNPWAKKIEEILEELGIEYYWEKNRAILKSQDAFKEVERLNQLLQKQKNLDLRSQSKVISIEKEKEQFRVFWETLGKTYSELFDMIVISQGGMFRIKDLGDEEKIYKIPQLLGHSLTQVKPSLSPLIIPSNPLASFAGIAFEAKLFDPVSKYTRTDSLIITHQGISGPLVLDFSAKMQGNDLELCFIPEITEQKFFDAFQKLRQGKNLLRFFLKTLLTQRIADWHIEQIGLALDINIADISKDKTQTLIRNLFHFPLKNVQPLDYPFCWTTQGGIPLTEVNIATLESKLHKKLYFAGEILDANGLCGGFNISFAALSAKIVSEAIINDQQTV